MDFLFLEPRIQAIIDSEKLSLQQRLILICGLLKSEVPHYDWVGFYFNNLPAGENELKLRAFSGKPTEHRIIPFGKGICGQVALSNKNFVVQDVQAQDNYLSCNIGVKSEIVVPLFLNGENIGQIDIDSHRLNPFTEEDERFLEFVNEKVAGILDADFLNSLER